MSLTTRSSSFISTPSSPEPDDVGCPLSPIPGRVVTEKPNVSGGDARGSCKCKRGCNTSQCACRKVGASCSISCDCMDAWAFCRRPIALSCVSPFQDLARIFGGINTKDLAQITTGGTQGGVGFYLHHSPLEMITTETANACFTTYLNGEDGIIDVNGLRTKLTGDSEVFEIDLILASWRAMLKSMQKKGSSEEKLNEHFQTLFQYGLSEKYNKVARVRNDRESLHTWSFCRGGWVDRDLVIHCWKCHSCYDDAWHCDTCGVCKIGRNFACDGCGGWSRIGAVEGTDEGRAVTAGRSQGRGKGRAEKRKRESMQDGSHAASRVTHA